ncbi:hypothetical protein DNTS_022295 [Danionella cerebrum]|uniref:Essential protein Yae1 N-terminal domain-containing protein n=1 Tax=Danionella cerebrum TaxID=2873325 RepID=A0A553MRK3_9TELE|nr:hypothetical protein DNTS_022295 [Danionella translucida]
MSWLRSVASSEEVFDEDVDDISLQNKEWKYNMEKRTQDGFREGIEAGKEASLQVAFNRGYREGASGIIRIAQLKGIMSAIRCWCQVHVPGTPALSSVTDLLQRVERHEDELVETLRRAQQRPPPSLTEMVDDMEELSVGQKSQDIESRCTCSGKDGANEDCSGIVRSKGEDSEMHSYGSSSKIETLKELQKVCLDLVTELELPDELKLHIRQLTGC